MKKYLYLLAALLITASCSNERDLYEPPQEPKEEQKDFSLTDKIKVTSNLPENTRCLLFTSDPSGENTVEPIMIAYAPFELDVPVAKAVSKLYTYVNGEIKTYTRGNITVNAPSIAQKAGATRAEGDEVPGSHTHIAIDAPFLTAINSYYPEKLVNVYGEDLKKSSDIVAYDGLKEVIEHADGSKTEYYWEKTKVWITYVTDGGSGFAGDLWYYTYNIDKETGIPTTPFDELVFVPIFNRASPSKVYPEDGPGKRIYLGEFPAGLRIGFKYFGNATYGNADYPKFSTPYYNGLVYNNRYTSGGRWTNSYNGGTISEPCSDFKDNAYTCGVIRVWDYNNTQYATLGMENRLPSESSWDGDFNDMLCLIEATPLAVENYIEPPAPDPITIKFAGYWLFEDNYPNEGDYDFNDLIIKYAITEIENKPTIIDLQFMARGADFPNSFGINGTIYFENLSGYENVYDIPTVSEQKIRQITLPRSEFYLPTLNNGTCTFDLKTYWDTKGLFPCVLEIPVTDGSKFLWCLENKRIDDAYPRYKDWVKNDCMLYTDWYLDTPVAGLVWDH